MGAQSSWWTARRGAGVALCALVVGAVSGCAVEPPATEVAFRTSAAAQQEPPRDPGELRVRLEELLGHHTFLVTRLSRGRLSDHPDVLETAVDALDANTRDLAAVVSSVYGADAARTFSTLWSTHTQSFYAYARALAADDRAGRRRAQAALDAYRTEFGEFVSSATDGELPADAVAANLEAHVGHLLAHADAYAAGDYDRAYRIQRQAYAHMFPTGETLAGGFSSSLPGEFPAPVDTGAQQLRSTLGMLLGEHAELAVDALRSGVEEAPDFDAAAAALDANSRDLAAAVQGLYGAETAREFADVWGDHIELFRDYAVAVAEDDDAGRAAVRRALDGYHTRLGDFFARVTAGGVTSQDVGALLATHDEQVLDAVEAYAEGDYATASDLTFTGYQHMFDTAAALAAAIEGAESAGLPRGGAQTGGGGAAPH